MKHFFSTLLLLSLVTVHPIQAQIFLIPKAGANLSAYRFSNSTSKYEWGITGGVGLNCQYPKLSWLSVQMELNYVPKKLSISSSTIITSEYVGEFEEVNPEPLESIILNGHSERNLNYVEVPILIRASLKNSKVEGFVNVGPSIGFVIDGAYENDLQGYEGGVLKIKGKVLFRKDPKRYTGSNIYYDRKAANRLDLGLQFGVGVSIPVGAGKLLFEARYGLGLNHLIKKHRETIDVGMLGNIYTNVPASQKSRVLALTCGYAIPLSL